MEDLRWLHKVLNSFEITIWYLDVSSAATS